MGFTACDPRADDHYTEACGEIPDPRLHYVPHEVVVDSEVSVDEAVSHTCHVPPVEFRVVLTGFADDLQASDGGPPASRVLQKPVGFEVVRLFDQLVGFIVNVLQVFTQRQGDTLFH